MNSERYARLHSATRREFLHKSGRFSLGAIALQSMLKKGGASLAANPMQAKTPPKPAKAKAVIYLSMGGGPPSLDLFDYKPELNRLNMKPCPESFVSGEKFAFIKGTPNLLGTPHSFAQQGQGGTWMSSLLPHTHKIADHLCIIRSLSTNQFNHAPAELLMYTGNMRSGAASMGSWVTYGLGSQNQDLPGFVALLSGGSDPAGGKACWGSGFLPGAYQGVQCRSVGDPILYVSNPDGMSRETRRKTLDALHAINQEEFRLFEDPETVTRIAQYELAYRMQVSVPETFDISREPESVRALYGAEPGRASFANNCLLARRLVEKGVRFVQLFDWGWDMHGTAEYNDLLEGLPRKTAETERAWSALIQDLHQREMLNDVLVVWGGEFGRTPMNEARDGSPFLGRDHHPHAFTIWLAGAGVKPGFNFGSTDEIGYHAVENKVGIRDLQATILHLLGLDPYRLDFQFQGLSDRLIGPTNEAKLISAIIS